MASIYPDEVVRKLHGRLEILPVLQIINYRLDTIQEIGETIKCFCPIHHEAVFRTLILDKKAKRYRCSYSLCPGNKGGDLVDLYAKCREVAYDNGLRELIDKLNISVDLPPSTDSIGKTLEIAGNYLTLQVYDHALENFQKVLAVEPNSTTALEGLLEIYRAQNKEEKRLEILKRLASVAMQERDFAGAAEYCLQVLDRQGDDLETHLCYIDCLIAQQQTHKALEEYMRLADRFESRQDYEHALDVYRRIERLDLDIIDVYPHIIQLMVASDRAREAIDETLAKAGEHERKGEYERALECYRYILEIDDTRSDVREKIIDTAIVAGLDDRRVGECVSLVEAFIREEAYASASRALDKLQQASPGNHEVIAKRIELLRHESRDSAAVEAQLELIDQLIKRGRMEEAAAQLRSVEPPEALAIDAVVRLAKAQQQCGLSAQASSSYLAASDRLRDEGRFEEAAELVGIAVQMNPMETPLRRQQIDLYLQAGRRDRAHERYAALAELAISRQKWDEAEAATTRALEIAPQDPQMLEFQAEVLHAQGRTAEALSRYMKLARDHVAHERWAPAKRTLLRILTSMDPNHVEAALLLAEVGAGLGDLRPARECLRRIANHLIAQKDFSQAELVLRQLHEIAPDDPVVLVQLASVYNNLGEEGDLLDVYRQLVTTYIANEAYPKAREYCTAILDRDPENIWALEQMLKVCDLTDKPKLIPELCLRLAQVYEKLDDADHVQEYYERALQCEPANVQARIDYIEFLRGLHRFEAASQQAQIVVGQLAEQRRHGEAIQLVEDLLRQTPDDVKLRRALIEMCRRAGLQRELISHCTQLINLFYRRNEFAEVVDLYRELLQLEPENVTFRTHLIDALLRLKRRDEAIQQYHLLAEFYLGRQNFEDAEHTLKNLLDEAPGNPRALELLVGILLETGRQEQAIQSIRELSEIYVGLGKPDKAVEMLRRILTFEPDNREARRRIAEMSREDQNLRASVEDLITRATEQWQEGDLSQALETQREAVRLRPEDTGIREKLAEMLTVHGSVTTSLDELLQIAQLRANRGHFESALAAVDAVLEHEPDHLIARRKRAEILARMGNQQKAIEEFMRCATVPTTPMSDDIAQQIAQMAGQDSGPLQVVSEFTFETFVVGENNRFAHATSMAVAKAPAVHYNPLFLYSDVGLGKTHLINAIANYILETQPELRVVYTTAEEFTSQLVGAIQNNTINLLRNRYKAAHMLLMDDIQFLAGKERAQEEFFHIFNALFQSKRQIVVTSDRPPKDIALLEKRLRSRFGSGVIVDIQAPDLETRTAILLKELTRHAGVQIENGLLSLIAEKVDSNIRELKGALNQVIVKHQLNGAIINADLVRGVLDIYAEEV